MKKPFFSSLIIFLLSINIVFGQVYRIKNSTNTIVTLKSDFNHSAYGRFGGNNDLISTQIEPGKQFDYRNGISGSVYVSKLYIITSGFKINTSDGNIWAGSCAFCTGGGNFEVVANSSGGSGGGSSSNAYRQILYGVDYTGYKLFHADMNLDGKTDAILIGPATVFTHFGTSNGISKSRVGTDYCEARRDPVYSGYKLIFEDADGDEIPDMVFQGPVHKFTHLGKSDGTFAAFSDRIVD